MPIQSLHIPAKVSVWLNGEKEAKKSPVSSRSESPISDALCVGMDRFSAQFYGRSRADLPYTDSDGLYDYPSSETVLSIAKVTRRNTRKSDRRRERKVHCKLNRNENDTVPNSNAIYNYIVITALPYFYYVSLSISDEQANMALREHFLNPESIEAFKDCPASGAGFGRITILNCVSVLRLQMKV